MSGWATFAAAALLLISIVLCSAGDKSKEGPSFKPGAEVTLQITLDSPTDWHLNDKVPLVFAFDEDSIKKAPFSVEKTTWEFTMDKTSERYVARIPVKLSKKAPEGILSIPLNVSCSICTDESGSCAFASEGFKVKLLVESKPSGDSKQSALGKGANPAHYRLSAPF